MGSYTITLTPDDSEDASAVVRVDLGAAGPRITELTVRAGTGDGLVPGEVPGVDLGRLLRAIAPSSGPAAVRPSAAEPPAVEPSVAEPGAAEPAATQPPVVESAAVERAVGSAATRKQASTKQATAKQARASKATAKQTAKQATAKQATGKQAAARKTSAARKRTAARTVASAEGTSRNRAYRRAPGDVVEVYSQAPSAAALASHYGVPRHTVQGWLRRLRAEGALPAATR